jgi:ABC-2 type transport system permease protein
MSARPTGMSGMTLIVKREIGEYLTTWSGYIIFAGLLLLTGLCYNAWAVGSTPRYSSDVLGDFFYFASGTTITTGLLLAMRLIAEERQTGTLPLLLTSSLTEGEIIAAKYVSAMVMIGIYLALTTFMPLLVFYNGAVSLGHIFAGYVGLLAIGSAGVAIGLFGSALVRSQLVAAIIAGVITVIMLVLWTIARVIEGTLGDVIGYLTLHDKHFRPFQDGTISSANVVFYASVTIAFLFAARNVLESRRWRM